MSGPVPPPATPALPSGLPETICPACRAALAPYEPLIYRSKRFFRCTGSVPHLWWWDGPSVLDARDPCRKLRFTGALIPLSPEQKEILAWT